MEKNVQGCSKPGQHPHFPCALADSHEDVESSNPKEKCAGREDNLSNAPSEDCPLDVGEADATSVLSQYRASTGAGMLALS